VRVQKQKCRGLLKTCVFEGLLPCTLFEHNGCNPIYYFEPVLFTGTMSESSFSGLCLL